MTDTFEPNPRAVAGGNEPPDTATMVAEQLAESYAVMASQIDALMLDARSMPETVDDDTTMGRVSAMVKLLGDKAKEAEAIRVKEKTPYLRGGNAVDSFCNAWKDRLTKASSILHARVHTYNRRKEAEERRRREEEAAEARRRAEAARLEQERRDREAQEAEEAARRARKPANVEVRSEAAHQAAATAGVARVNTMLAEDEARATELAAAQKPAAMVRTRHEDGVLTTMKQVPYVEVIDRDKLDKAALWPFFKDDAILAAVKAWAKTKNHRTPMDGAVIEMQNQTVVR